VFDGIQPSLNRVLAVVKDELHLWSQGQSSRSFPSPCSRGSQWVSSPPASGQGSGLCLERDGLCLLKCVGVCMVL